MRLLAFFIFRQLYGLAWQRQGRPQTLETINKSNMKLTDIDIIAQIERLAEACPWDKVQLWITRRPEGKYDFTCYLEQDSKYGFPSVFSGGKTPSEAVDSCIAQAGDRHPEAARRKALEELREKIAKLEAVVIGLPPYRPRRELSNGAPAIKTPDPIIEA